MHGRAIAEVAVEAVSSLEADMCVCVCVCVCVCKTAGKFANEIPTSQLAHA